MPELKGERLAIAFDMHGCPNRCRHCYLGPGTDGKLSESDVRWCVSRFRDFIAANSSKVRELSVSTWFREPDYGSDYRKLYDLETELSDGVPFRFELLSTWRLARDETYAEWAKSIGPVTCQISFAGMEEVTDWFCRRKGAFSDAVSATERLLSAGMVPRWQIFLTSKLLPDIDALLELSQKLHLRERVNDLGHEFRIFIHLPGPDHEGRKIEEFRPAIDQIAGLPDELLLSSRKYLRRDVLWQTEEALIINSRGLEITEAEESGMPWFFICSSWDVYSNLGTLEPWWRLGNLKKDTVETIVSRFESDNAAGLKALFHVSDDELIEDFGDMRGQKIYTDTSDLLSLYRAEYCEREWEDK